VQSSVIEFVVLIIKQAENAPPLLASILLARACYFDWSGSSRYPEPIQLEKAMVAPAAREKQYGLRDPLRPKA